MKSTGAKVRADAAEVVDAVVSSGLSLDAAIAKNEPRIAPGDRSLMRMLCYGSLRHHWRLRAWINQLVQKPLRKRDSVVESLLAVGLYQITSMRIPDHAVVSETVEATRTLGRPKLAGLVNACLRRFTRDNIAASSIDELAKWNHPGWMIERIRKDWPDDWEAILTANNERAPMWLRANASRNSAEQYKERLIAADMKADLIDGIPDAVRLVEPCAVEDLP